MGRKTATRFLNPHLSLLVASQCWLPAQVCLGPFLHYNSISFQVVMLNACAEHFFKQAVGLPCWPPSSPLMLSFDLPVPPPAVCDTPRTDVEPTLIPFWSSLPISTFCPAAPRHLFQGLLGTSILGGWLLAREKGLLWTQHFYHVSKHDGTFVRKSYVPSLHKKLQEQRSSFRSLRRWLGVLGRPLVFCYWICEKKISTL